MTKKQKENHISTIYNKKVMDEFMNPKNVGEIKDADGIGQVGNPVCGDIMRVSIKVGIKECKKIISDIKFKTMGCAAAIATSSMITQIAKGKSLDEAMKINKDSVAKDLGGLPQIKMHCSNLAADGLHAAIEDYLKRKTEKK